MKKTTNGTNTSRHSDQREQQACPELGEAHVSANAIGKHYNVTGRYILKLAAEGSIPCIRIGKKCVRFRPSAVARAIEENQGISSSEES